MNRSVVLSLLTVLVLVIFAVNKVYENHHHLSTPLVLEVDEAQFILLRDESAPSAGSTGLTMQLLPDNLQMSANQYISSGTQFMSTLQEQLNPWLSQKPKLVSKRAIIYARAIKPMQETARRLLRQT